ncbi:MAG: hypothetical protein GX847_07075 [Clostridiales bacterium]|nr:hypothetical protein [Clostridiales bacterium]
MLYLGLAAFIMFFVGDLNDWRYHKRLLKPSFFAGTVLLAVSTFGFCLTGESALPPVSRFAFIALALIFVILTFYSVFSVVFMSSGTGERSVYSGRLYALCRHPGFLFFVPLYLCLWPAFGFPLYAVIIYSVLNLLLIIFEDALVFPALLRGYDNYKQEVPFILPTPASIKRLLGK